MKTKSEKRPRKPRTTSPADELLAAVLVLDQGRTLEQAADETGIGSVQVIKTAVAREEGRRQGLVEASIKIADLPKTYQKQYEILTRKLTRELLLRESQRVSERLTKFVNNTWLPIHQQKIDEARKIYDNRRGVMDAATFDAIRRCLHPDSRHSLSDKKLAEAFDLFNSLEKRLLNEKDSPTNIPDLPDTVEAWDAMRTPRARRGHSNVERR
jgi:hypothetical protein